MSFASVASSFHRNPLAAACTAAVATAALAGAAVFAHARIADGHRSVPPALGGAHWGAGAPDGAVLTEGGQEPEAPESPTVVLVPVETTDPAAPGDESPAEPVDGTGAAPLPVPVEAAPPETGTPAPEPLPVPAEPAPAPAAPAPSTPVTDYQFPIRFDSDADGIQDFYDDTPYLNDGGDPDGDGLVTSQDDMPETNNDPDGDGIYGTNDYEPYSHNNDPGDPFDMDSNSNDPYDD
jgi:hypothetical protein